MQKFRSQNLKIQKTIDSLIQRKHMLATKIEAAESRFPALLAAHALGEITDSELSEEREALIQFKVSFEEIPLTIQGLEARQAEIKDQLRVTQRKQERKDAKTLFKQLKPQFEEKYSRHLEDRLRALSVILGTRGEVEPFLLEARQQYDRIPLCDR